MNGGSRIVGLRRDTGSAAASPEVTDDELLLEEYYSSEFDDPRPAESWPNIVRFVLAGLAVAWLAFSLWILFASGAPLPGIEQVPQTIAVGLAPLILIGTAYILLIRNSRTEAARFGQTAQRLQRESDALEKKLSQISTQLADARSALQEQANLLQNYGASASANLEASAKLISTHAAEAAEQTTQAERAGAELAAQITGLVRTMPTLEERASSIAAQLLDNAQAMEGRIDSLERRLQAVMAISDDARLRTLSATKSLTTQLAQLQEETRSASDEINGMAELAASRIDVALGRARTALEETATGLEGQATALNALVEQSKVGIAHLGEDTLESFTEQSDRIETRMTEINRLMEVHGTAAATLGDTLSNKLGDLEERFAQFESQGVSRTERLSTAFSALASDAERVNTALTATGETADQLIARSEGLLHALEASMKDVETAYPAALERLDGKIGESREKLVHAGPEIEELTNATQTLLDRAREADILLRDQGEHLSHWLAKAEGGLSASRTQVEELQGALQTADEGAARLMESAGPQLVAALVRVKDTADQAAERARQALSRAIPEAVEALGEASEQAIQNAIAQQVTAQMAQLSDVAEKAMATAQQASDRLSRQLVTISEASASVEQRIAEIESANDGRERAHFTSRSAQLIESLNSTAIDVAKVLSGNVTDNDWAAYLKGDRGVFTRHAVKLLNAGEAREIGLHYDRDSEFREHVNRYIHDFEGMLRIILPSKDGNALAVTLLSSDMGKLYVALAQAIDRLRT